MGLFGGSKPDMASALAWKNAQDAAFQSGAPASSAFLFMDRQPQQLTGAQKLQLLGASLRDAGAGFQGGQGNALNGVESAIQKQSDFDYQQQAAKAAAGLFGGEFANTPAAMPALLRASAAGVDVGSLMQLGDQARQRKLQQDYLATVPKEYRPRAALDLKGYLKDSVPQVVNAGNGNVVSIDQLTGKPTVIYSAPHQAPTGYEWSPGGGLNYIHGGPADPNVAKPLADAKRAPRIGSSKRQAHEMSEAELRAIAGAR